jgi:ribonucleoside-diphosphate reductase alpha chain
VLNDLSRRLEEDFLERTLEVGIADRRVTSISEVCRYFYTRQIAISSAILARHHSDDPEWMQRGIACTAADYSTFANAFNDYRLLHALGSGIGFDLTHENDPVRALLDIKQWALRCELQGIERRQVGDSVTLDIDHPKMHEFLDALSSDELSPVDTRLCINVRCESTVFTSKRYPRFLDRISEEVLSSGRPGLVFWDKYTARNPNPSTSPRTTVAPCAELALANHEGCIFGYLNVAAFDDQGVLDASKLQHATRQLVLFLDLLIDLLSSQSIHRFYKNLPATRRIGVGICGFADLLRNRGLRYGDAAAHEIAREIGRIIQIASKSESIALSQELGSYPLWNEHDCQYAIVDWRMAQFGRSAMPDKAELTALCRNIRTNGLRNQTTVCFPPTGKSSILVQASPGIEPFEPRCRDRKIAITRGGVAVPWKDQIDMAATFNDWSDDAVSKTVTFEERSTSSDVIEAFSYAADVGLCGISGYVYV